VRVRPKTTPRRDHVVVENAERPPVQVLGIDVIGETERMIRLQPAMIEERALAGALDRSGWNGLCANLTTYNLAWVAPA